MKIFDEEEFRCFIDLTKEFQRDLDKLINLIKKLPPFKTLGVISDLCLLTSGCLNESDDPLLETNLEIIQALFLIYGDVDCKNSFSAEDIIEICDLCSDVAKKYDGYVRGVQGKISRQHESFQMALSSIRINSQFYRNWGYGQDVSQAMRDLLVPINDRIIQLAQVDLLKLMDVSDYFQAPKVLNSVHSKLVRNLRLGRINRKELLGRLVELNESEGFESYSLYSLSSISSDLSINIDEISNIISKLSLRVSSNSKLDPRSLFLNNPIWKKPIIEVDEGELFLPVPNIFNSFIIDVLLGVLEASNNSDKAVDSFYRRRGKFVEEKSEMIFKKAFPIGSSYKGYSLEGSGGGEKDLVYKYGDVLFLVEAKSNKMTSGFRNGDIRYVRKYLNETIVKASSQTASVIESVKRNKKLVLSNPKGGSVEISSGSISKVVRIVVMFTDLYGMHTNFRDFKDIIGHGLDNVAVFSLLDLKVVFETLCRPSERLDYIIYRSKMAKVLNFKGDEMDLLGIYLRNRMRFNFDKYEGNVVVHNNSSSVVDAYKVKQWYADPDAVVPKVKIDRYWESLIEKLENELRDNVRITMEALYAVTYEEQLDLGDRLRSIKLKPDEKEYFYEFLYVESLNQGVVLFITKERVSNLKEIADSLSAAAVKYSSRIEYLNIFLLDLHDDDAFYGYIRRSYI